MLIVDGTFRGFQALRPTPLDVRSGIVLRIKHPPNPLEYPCMSMSVEGSNNKLFWRDFQSYIISRREMYGKQLLPAAYCRNFYEQGGDDATQTSAPKYEIYEKKRIFKKNALVVKKKSPKNIDFSLLRQTGSSTTIT